VGIRRANDYTTVAEFFVDAYYMEVLKPIREDEKVHLVFDRAEYSSDIYKQYGFKKKDVDRVCVV
jgi:hypothetical protein